MPPVPSIPIAFCRKKCSVHPVPVPIPPRAALKPSCPQVQTDFPSPSQGSVHERLPPDSWGAGFPWRSRLELWLPRCEWNELGAAASKRGSTRSARGRSGLGDSALSGFLPSAAASRAGSGPLLLCSSCPQPKVAVPACPVIQHISLDKEQDPTCQDESKSHPSKQQGSQW